MRILLFSLPLLFFCLCQTPEGLAASRPEDLPGLLQRALDEGDSAAALEHIDIEAVLAAVVEDDLPSINASVGRGELLLSPPLTLALSGLNSKDSVKQAAEAFLAAELRKFIIYGIDSGAFAGRPLPHNERMRMDGGVFANLGLISTARKEFSRPQAVLLDEKTALLDVLLFDSDTKAFYPLKLRLRQKGPDWEICRVENVKELMENLIPSRGR